MFTTKFNGTDVTREEKKSLIKTACSMLNILNLKFSIVPFFSSSLLLLPITKNKNVLVLRKFSMTFDILKLAQECVKIPRPKSDCKFHLPKFFRSTLSKKGSVIGSWNEKMRRILLNSSQKFNNFWLGHTSGFNLMLMSLYKCLWKKVYFWKLVRFHWTMQYTNENSYY